MFEMEKLLNDSMDLDFDIKRILHLGTGEIRTHDLLFTRQAL